MLTASMVFFKGFPQCHIQRHLQSALPHLTRLLDGENNQFTDGLAADNLEILHSKYLIRKPVHPTIIVNIARFQNALSIFHRLSRCPAVFTKTLMDIKCSISLFLSLFHIYFLLYEKNHNGLRITNRPTNRRIKKTF